MSELSEILELITDTCVELEKAHKEGGYTHAQFLIEWEEAYKEAEQQIDQYIYDLFIELIKDIEGYMINAKDLPREEVRINDLLKEVKAELRKAARERLL